MMRRLFLAGTGALVTGGCSGLSETELAQRWPPLGEILDVDGLPVHVWEQGEGRPVILIHGASGNLRDWTFALAPELAKSYRVIAFDRPGFGWSARLLSKGWEPAAQAAHLSKAAQKLDAKGSILVGHSWGGALAMAWALNRPEQLSGVVTLGGATMPWGGELSFFYSLVASEFPGRLISRIVNASLDEARIEGFLSDVFAPQPVPKGYGTYIGGPLATRAETLRHNARDLTNLERLLIAQSSRYGEIQLPVEILHGIADTTVYADIHAKGMHGVLPRSRLSLLKGIGHMPHHVAAPKVIAAIDRLHRT